MSETASTETGDNPNYVLCMAETTDYRIERRKFGLTMVANRDIDEGEDALDETMEFTFRDVDEGDFLLFVKNWRSWKKDYDSDDSDAEEEKTNEPEGGECPITYPIDDDTLFDTHGMPLLVPNPDKNSTELKERWFLESPSMLMDHSCEPNILNDGFDFIEGRSIALRDIKKGETLTCDYAAFDYDEDGETFQCQCGSKNCRGELNGFEYMTDEAKKKMLKEGVSDVVQARHNHSLGLGPPVTLLEEAPLTRPPKLDNVPRLVVPGPSFSQDTTTCDVAIRPCEPTTTDCTVKYGLFAMQDFKKGACVYWCWSLPWPTFPDGIDNSVIDMVSATVSSESDLPEGTVVRIEPRLCASRDGKTGWYNFTGFDLLTQHSCDPNIVYDPVEEQDQENWRAGYACRDIQKGEQLFVDFNCIMWDRLSTDECDKENSMVNMKNCKCGSDNCRGIAQGFRHLPPEAQDELYGLSWRRAVATKEKYRGKALSNFIRKQLQK